MRQRNNSGVQRTVKIGNIPYSARRIREIIWSPIGSVSDGPYILEEGYVTETEDGRRIILNKKGLTAVIN